jgi:hypothetical protein
MREGRGEGEGVDKYSIEVATLAILIRSQICKFFVSLLI